MSAFPSPKAFVDAAVRVFGRLGAGKLLLHAFHTGAERVAPAAALGLGCFQPRLARIGFVVRSTAFRVQAALGVLAFFALPCF